MQAYDLVVIGSGPAGQRAAIQGAKIGKRVALIERREVVGGACINTGTIPSKTMREAVMHLSGYRYQGIYGMNYRVKEKITMADLSFRIQKRIFAVVVALGTLKALWVTGPCGFDFWILNLKKFSRVGRKPIPDAPRLSICGIERSRPRPRQPFILTVREDFLSQGRTLNSLIQSCFRFISRRWLR